MRVRVIIIVLALIQGGDFFTAVEKVLKCTYISSALDILCLAFYTICFNESKKNNNIWYIPKVTLTRYRTYKIEHLSFFATFRGCMHSMAKGDG